MVMRCAHHNAEPELMLQSEILDAGTLCVASDGGWNLGKGQKVRGAAVVVISSTGNSRGSTGARRRPRRRSGPSRMLCECPRVSKGRPGTAGSGSLEPLRDSSCGGFDAWQSPTPARGVERRAASHVSIENRNQQSNRSRLYLRRSKKRSLPPEGKNSRVSPEFAGLCTSVPVYNILDFAS